MTVAPRRQPTQCELVKEQAERAIGSPTAKRIAVFDNGGLYVEAGSWARLLAWLVDFVVFVLVAGVGLIAIALVDRELNLDDGAVTLALIGVLFLAPLLYGLFFGNGRALGAVLTGTQVVRRKTGGRVGLKAPWAMMVRTLLLPLLIGGYLVGALAGGGGAPAGSLARVPVDADATRRLHAAGFVRLA